MQLVKKRKTLGFLVQFKKVRECKLIQMQRPQIISQLELTPQLLTNNLKELIYLNMKSKSLSKILVEAVYTLNHHNRRKSRIESMILRLASDKKMRHNAFLLLHNHHIKISALSFHQKKALIEATNLKEIYHY